jgi:SSS family transporter
MSTLDWIIMGATLLLIVVYGVYKSRGQKNIQSYLLADRQLPWYHVCLSVMATQASAITFLSAPGQAYTDGMRFVQFYFGLPLATIVLCIWFLPIFHRLNVYTAYEYLEQRFDLKSRSLTAILFLIQRGVSTGITIYAPSIILAVILGVDIKLAIFIIGGLVVVYTVFGGTKAVSYTQMLQMGIIFSGLLLAGILVVTQLPQGIGFTKALQIAGVAGKMNVIDWKFDWNNRYTVWSGILGGFFLQLSYFGTDQSQVGRYLTGKSIAESRLGLIMNGIVKIPMQFLILLIGILVFAFYQFNQAPLYFNTNEVTAVKQTADAARWNELEKNYQQVSEEKKLLLQQYADGADRASITPGLKVKEEQAERLRKDAFEIVKKNNPKADSNDSNYVFLYYVTTRLPKGVVGLLIAIIFLAAMGSTASGLNSLASTSAVDIYKRMFRKEASDQQYLNASRLLTLFWGLFCMGIALFASQLGNLIEAVNILGSLFYGTILGIFLTAFALKKVNGTQVFAAALITEVFVVLLYASDKVSYLWLNPIGALSVMLVALLLQKLMKNQSPLNPATRATKEL